MCLPENMYANSKTRLYIRSHHVELICLNRKDIVLVVMATEKVFPVQLRVQLGDVRNISSQYECSIKVDACYFLIKTFTQYLFRSGLRPSLFQQLGFVRRSFKKLREHGFEATVCYCWMHFVTPAYSPHNFSLLN